MMFGKLLINMNQTFRHNSRRMAPTPPTKDIFLPKHEHRVLLGPQGSPKPNILAQSREKYMENEVQEGCQIKHDFLSGF